MKRNIKPILRVYRSLTSRARVLPDFLIIGAQKGGTTSLYNNLAEHPSIAPAWTKEIHFFDTRFARGLPWYRAYFPLSATKAARRLWGRGMITGEASPYYLFHPHTPRRVAATLPNVKLIALLRNPVDRAYSHYNHEVRLGFETLPFDEAIAREQERLQDETTKLLSDETYNSYNHQHFAYLARGVYVDQLQCWAEHFSQKQLLVIRSEDFYEDPAAVMRQTLAFLGLPAQVSRAYERYNSYTYQRMDPAARRRLLDYFAPHNQRLYEYLGRDLGWEA